MDSELIGGDVLNSLHTFYASKFNPRLYLILLVWMYGSSHHLFPEEVLRAARRPGTHKSAQMQRVLRRPPPPSPRPLLLVSSVFRMDVTFSRCAITLIFGDFQQSNM